MNQMQISQAVCTCAQQSEKVGLALAIGEGNIPNVVQGILAWKLDIRVIVILDWGHPCTNANANSIMRSDSDFLSRSCIGSNSLLRS